MGQWLCIWSAGDRVDQMQSHELAVLTRVAAAEDAGAMVRDTAPVIGMLAGRILELFLIEGLTITRAAQRMDGHSARPNVFFWSDTFRRACKSLADHWCGPRHRLGRNKWARSSVLCSASPVTIAAIRFPWRIRIIESDASLAGRMAFNILCIECQQMRENEERWALRAEGALEVTIIKRR